MEEKRNAYRILVGKPERSWRHRRGWYGLDRPDSGYGPMEDSCEYGNEPSGSIKCWEFLE
jgi:hypothetical protein